MAKAQSKKTTASRKSGRHRTNDAARFAALRWLGMRIEQLGIEILVTSPAKFAAVENAMRAQVRLLKQIGREAVAVEGCPDGYILCRDGLCSPICDDDVALMAGKARTRRR